MYEHKKKRLLEIHKSTSAKCFAKCKQLKWYLCVNIYNTKQLHDYKATNCRHWTMWNVRTVALLYLLTVQKQHALGQRTPGKCGQIYSLINGVLRFLSRCRKSGLLLRSSIFCFKAKRTLRFGSDAEKTKQEDMWSISGHMILTSQRRFTLGRDILPT